MAESYTYQDLCVISTFHQGIPINDTAAADKRRIFRKRILGACFTIQLTVRAVRVMYDLQMTRCDRILSPHKSGGNRVKLWNQIHGHNKNVSSGSCCLVKMAESEDKSKDGQ